MTSLTGPINPPNYVAGQPSRLLLCEVVTLNPDGTVDVRPINGRATKVAVPVAAGVQVGHGNRVVLAELDGDVNKPVVLSALQGKLDGSAIAAGTLPGDAIAAGTLPESALAAPEPWHVVGDPGEPTFLNGWTQFEATTPARKARFTRHLGWTILAGVIKGGTSSVRAFNLPPGFRPASDYQETSVGEVGGFPVVCSGGVAQLSVYGDHIAANYGAVVPTNLAAGTNVAAFCYLDGVRFRHE